MKSNDNQKAFFALVKAGLWGQECRLLPFGGIDFKEVYRIAEEQSVVGLVAAGLEHVVDVKAPKEDMLQFVGQALLFEKMNQAMNKFVAVLVDKLRKEGVYSLLLKGQGVAQCYARPLWRACGDVDLFLSEDNYIKAKAVLTTMASNVEDENEFTKHIGMTIYSWEVELHGSLRSELYSKIDRGLDKIKDDIFFGGTVRSWQNGQTQVFLPGANNDAVYIFTHILQHFFKGGIGLRQICDWCRMLWTYKDTLDCVLLERRIREMGLMSEWKAFGALAVNSLGMPVEAMPFYDTRYKIKGEKVLAFVLETGNFGQNRDMSFRQESVTFSRKWKMFLHITSDTIKQFSIFPLDSIRVWYGMMVVGLKSLVGR